MFKYFNKYFVVLTLIVGGLNGLVLLTEPVITNKIFDLSAINDKQDVLGFLLYGLFLYLILYSIMFVANLLINHMMTIGCGNIRLRLYRRLILGHREMSHDEKVSMLTQDVEYYLWNHISPSIMLVLDISDSSIVSFYLLSKNMTVGLIFILFSLVFLALQYAIGQMAEQKGSQQTIYRQELLSSLSDLIAGSATLRQNQAIMPSLDKINERAKEYENSRQTFEIVRSFFSFLANILLFISQILPLFLGLILIATGVVVKTTDLIAMFLASTRLNQPLMSLVDDIFKLRGAASISKSFEAILDRAVSEPTNQSFSREKFESLVCSQLSKSSGERQLFKELSYTFDKRKKYLIKGPSGSGKSTFFKLILDDLQLDSGSIVMLSEKGTVIKDCSHRIGLIAQSPYLFNASIRYNLTLGESFSDELLLDKLTQVGLTDEFDHILDYQIVNNGENISGGQKARLEIARSLLRQKDILLADEVTASLDEKNAYKVRQLLFSLPVTIIEIAHHVDEDFVYDGVINF